MLVERGSETGREIFRARNLIRLPERESQSEQLNLIWPPSMIAGTWWKILTQRIRLE
jgi:hypothetical protein